MRTIVFLSTFIFLTIGACSILRPAPVVEYDRVPATKNRNVCKFMEDTIVVYAIFVDVSIYHPWTEFDIKTTMDSLQKATNWLDAQAAGFRKNLHFSNIRHDQSGKWTINESRAHVSLALNGLMSMERNKRHSIRKLNPWADAIAKYAGKGLKYTPSGKIATRFRIHDKQSLMLALRDRYASENVALLFFVNGYYESHPSYTLFSETDGPDVEFSIITGKNPAVISHELLHLFGAVDLYPNKNYPNFNYEKLYKYHPDEIMRIQHKQLSKLNISPITGYFVGWQDTLDADNMHLLLHKRELIPY
jgi:hypothetical protein